MDYSRRHLWNYFTRMIFDIFLPRDRKGQRGTLKSSVNRSKTISRLMLHTYTNDETTFILCICGRKIFRTCLIAAGTRVLILIRSFFRFFFFSFFIHLREKASLRESFQVLEYSLGGSSKNEKWIVIEFVYFNHTFYIQSLEKGSIESERVSTGGC